MRTSVDLALLARDSKPHERRRWSAAVAAETALSLRRSANTCRRHRNTCHTSLVSIELEYGCLVLALLEPVAPAESCRPSSVGRLFRRTPPRPAVDTALRSVLPRVAPL